MKKGLGSLLVGVRCNAAHLWLVEAALRKEPQQCQEQSGAADWKKFQSFRKTVSRLLHKVLCVLIKYQTIWLRLLTGIITSNHRKNLHLDVCSNFTHNYPKLEAIQTSFS